MFQKYIKNSISDKNKGIKSLSFQISQQCITVLCRIPSILSCQYPVCTILFYLFQLFAKRCASFCIRPLSPIFIFSIKYCFLGFFLMPVVPTFVHKVATDETDTPSAPRHFRSACNRQTHNHNSSLYLWQEPSHIRLPNYE